MLRIILVMPQGTATFNSRDPDKQVQVQTLSSNDTVVVLPGVVHSVRTCTQTHHGSSEQIMALSPVRKSRCNSHPQAVSCSICPLVIPPERNHGSRMHELGRQDFPKLPAVQQCWG